MKATRSSPATAALQRPSFWVWLKSRLCGCLTCQPPKSARTFWRTTSSPIWRGGTGEILATELQGLIDLDFEVELTGFTTAAIDLIIGPSNKASRKTALSPKDPIHHHLPGPAVCRGGDSWVLGPYRLRCEDAREGACELLLQGDLDFVDMAIRHWQAHSGDTAILASTGQTFGEIEQARLNTRTIATDKTSAAALKEARDD